LSYLGFFADEHAKKGETQRNGIQRTMALKIEDYGMIGDCQTAALVGNDGSIDWLCWPDFSSPACFSSLLGTEKNGHWQISPVENEPKVSRSYRDSTMILETEFETPTGRVLVVDFMPIGKLHSEEMPQPRKYSDLVRMVKGLEGSVEMQMELRPRFDYGRTLPWTGLTESGAWYAYAGPAKMYMRTEQPDGVELPIERRDESAFAKFTVSAGQQYCFGLTHCAVEEEEPKRIDIRRAFDETEKFWTWWNSKSLYQGKWKKDVDRSLMTLKALTYRPSGGIVAAVTTSLPEVIGAGRNWDYRYCWLRDGALTLESLVSMGHNFEAQNWQQWLLRSVGSDPEQLQIMYGIRGDRHLPEFELPWLAGYENSLPVRVGNAASEQAQLDVFGEVADVLYCIKGAGIADDENVQRLRLELARHLAKVWKKPSSNIWEQRNDERDFTYSKVMAWVGMDRTAKAIEEQGLPGDPKPWREVRDAIFKEVCEEAFDQSLNCFVQSYGADTVDASCLLIPMFGFLPFKDPRIVGTIEMIKKMLMNDGLLMRFSTVTEKTQDSCFLACSFWLVECLVEIGRREDAEKLFERLLGLQNDLGLLPEEYDPKLQRALGNFPQALTHIALISAARRLDECKP
jgi:GH15 family glucan-1,4-alpha-glucosidase